ncbi:hypothetical protein QE152_g33743 [Popillia japonica]|uniref:Uncharacterized protein n=1 Tax=Popillia japonica TaxID=7064 RepID=A0AAW1IVU1_POPJA
MFTLIFLLVLLRFFVFTYECTTSDDYYWRDYSFGSIPYDAVEINNDGKYIGQVYLKGGLLPATIFPYLGYAVTELFGKQIIRQQIKILCCPDQSGFYKDDNYDFNYFIGKLFHEGVWKAGKVIPHEHRNKGFYIWNNTDGKTVKLTQFHMLKYNSSIVAPGITRC